MLDNIKNAKNMLKKVEVKDKDGWGFRAFVTKEGQYRMDVDTYGMNISELGVLTILHQKIGEYLLKSAKGIKAEFHSEFEDEEK